ncbi:MAG: hypothetical protein AAFN07_04765 [Pseudomonadota bacterium]
MAQTPLGALNSLGIVMFGTAHLALAKAMHGKDHGQLWPIARTLLCASGVVLFYVAYYFESLEPFATDTNDPLWMVASLTGLAMGAAQPGLSRRSPRTGLFSTICLGLWLWLVPLAFFVNASWIGAYERLVGIIYLTWVGGIAIAIDQRTGFDRH